ncbi:bifunctional 2-polyprenyl-6-hydroxyphenol methylase/3-demethylubiquinol 3-O-methyltransferase UbiG [Streptomyces sp. WP-1]|uniref:class I SAM-dependent methyltransferase n=1 Tax=Streptomyces sp. WP-1 TaxID=3041497 RepID=UPI002647E18A|nr:class I SAM-dependent methyltransferase [Streptomyces sp. WP-1]WKE67956.1 class I SAM-dependent methyltransferase [Streptomyces sp. WP-1]
MTWEWDETLFAGAAEHYERGRLPYAPGLVPLLAGALSADGRGRLLDVGCGPGTVTVPLAALFHEAVGIDPDPGMIRAAERRAAAAGMAGRTRWARLRAEELPAGLGLFGAVVFAQSFHWTDRARVARTVRALLRPGGALVHLADLKGERRTTGGSPYPAVPHEGIAALVKEYLGPVRRAGRGLLPQGTPGGEARILAEAGFLGPERHVVPGGGVLERTADDVVAWTFSHSFAAPHLFGPRLDSFEEDLRGLLAEVSPKGRFAERAPSTEVFIWRNSGPV